MKKVINYYNGISEGYNELYLEEQLDKYNFIKDSIPAAERTLDLGCGTGKITKKLKAKIIVGADISFEMIKKAEIKNKIVCSAENLPFKNKSFDLVLSLTMLQDIEDKKRAVNEIKRVCGKSFIVSILKKNRTMEEISNLFGGKVKILEQEKDYFVVK